MKSSVVILNKTTLVNESKKTVVCVLKCKIIAGTTDNGIFFNQDAFKKLPNISSELKFNVVGKAKCSEGDTFDSKLGTRIAESKAKAKMFSTTAKFWNTIESNTIKLAKKAHDKADYNEILSKRELDHVEELYNNQSK